MLATKKSFDSLLKLFKECFLWNISETVIYQLLLVGHQVALFAFLPKELFGLQASLFASLFFLVTILDGALDLSYIPFFQFFTSSKRSFKTLLLPLLIFQFIILTSGALLLLFLSSRYQIPVSLKIIFGLLIVFEGMKKNIRSFLQIALFYKYTVVIEVINIGAYVSLVWGSYFYYKTLSLELLFYSFLFVSVVSNIFLYKALHNYYQTLSKETNELTTFSIKNYITTRIYLYINQITRIFFSSNFFIPYIALRTSVEKISSLSLLHTITFTTQSLLQKIFGPTAAAMFVASNKEKSFEAKKSVFLFIQKLFLSTIGGCIGATCLYIPFIKMIDPTTNYYTLLFFVIFFTIFHLLESSFLVYEKFLMSIGKVSIITAFNGFSCLIGTIICLQKLPLVTTLFLLCTTRLCIALFMSIITQKKYSIPFHNAIRSIIITALISISALYYMAHIIHYA